MTQYFADTVFFIALYQPRDAFHSVARDFALTPNLRLVTTTWILAEVADGFAVGSNREGVASFIQGLVAHQDNIIVPATDDWFYRGLQLYKARPDKEWSLTDCISFEVMRELELAEALTADRHFEQAGFAAVLKHKG